MTSDDRRATAQSGDGESSSLGAETFPVAHSLLNADALLDEVTRAYAIARPAGCALFRSYANDVYRVSAADAAYFLKVYRFGWRSASEIAYELDVLAHLAAGGVDVAPAVPRRDGRLIGELPAPEGIRYYALFSAAPGAKPRRPFDAALRRWQAEQLD
jgi:Ser/Thr protein kinase RdoA (MazF antagonist)